MVSRSRSQVYVFIVVTGRTIRTLTITWSFQFIGVGVETSCVGVGGGPLQIFTLPATVTLTGRGFASGACGERFDVDRARLRVSIRDQAVFDEILTPLPFHFEP